MIYESLPPHLALLPGLALAGIVFLPARARKWLREHLTRHAWIGDRSRYCIAHDRCRGRIRYYNEHGVRLCEHDAVLATGDGWALHACDLYRGHPGAHYDVKRDRTWPR